MLTLATTTKFRKDTKRMLKRGADIHLLKTVVDALLAGKRLEPQQKDHALKGKYIGLRECHIQPDWLLMYEIDGENLILTAIRTGTHDDLRLE
ncbi:MAG: type II toxin-antitoxin system YafQ family toxin [Oscillospiraceae bacterium]|nr:type II toxin-antitoxin system YafQ family toxin [Oscillospiraceae bacterium]